MKLISQNKNLFAELSKSGILPSDAVKEGKLYHMKKLEYDLDLNAACQDEQKKDEKHAE